MNKLKSTWVTLGEPIYRGDRLNANLRALTLVSVVTTCLSLILMLIDYTTHQYIMFAAATLTFVCAVACGYSAGVLKNRELAGVFPTLFCGIAFTIYAVTGAGEGSAMLWTLLMPMGISYFVSVRYSLILSAYYTLLFVVLFHSPLKNQMAAYYTASFMQRFPLLFASLALFTGIAMVQYHRMALFEIEHTDTLNAEVAKQTKVARDHALRLEHITEELVYTLAHVIDAKDRYTNGHSIRVSQYAVALGRRLGWSEEELNALCWEALLHDIGKIGVPDAVLNKPGRLTDEEFEVIKSHTTTGGDILAESTELLDASATARYHHERYDGKGYPEGLSGQEIPVHARVVAVADAFDAMNSDRIYRKGLPRDVIRDELVKGRGTQFDPEYVDAFLQLFDEGVLGTL